MALDVPVIDLSGWGTGGDADRDITVALGDACRSLGFFQIVGHGVPDTVRAGLHAVADSFFDLPRESKLVYRPPAPEVNRGYAPSGSESLSYSIGEASAPDLFEAYNVGVEGWPAGDAYYEAERARTFAPNLWPTEVPAMRSAVLTYFQAVAGLAHRLTTIMAAALGMPADHFEPSTDRSVDILRMIRYDRGPDDPAPSPGQMRMGAHTDYGILTVLMADPVPGLQISGRDGSWHDVVPVEDGFVVNLGDALAVWTNDHWRSTLHRVVPPTASTGRARRRSYAFFHDGNLDAQIACLPTCEGPGDPPRYPPITVREHINAKLLGPRTRVQPDTVQTAKR